MYSEAGYDCVQTAFMLVAFYFAINAIPPSLDPALHSMTSLSATK
jgi:hypothetical protein